MPKLRNRVREASTTDHGSSLSSRQAEARGEEVSQAVRRLITDCADLTYENRRMAVAEFLKENVCDPLEEAFGKVFVKDVCEGQSHRMIKELAPKHVHTAKESAPWDM
jgi:ribosomal protein L17